MGSGFRIHLRESGSQDTLFAGVRLVLSLSLVLTFMLETGVSAGAHQLKAGACLDLAQQAVGPTFPNEDESGSVEATDLDIFVEWLKENAHDPQAFVLDALTEHKLVIIGEVHHRPLYWAFAASLIRDPGFGQRAGTIYLELPAHCQALMDRFLTGSACDSFLLNRILRDMAWRGCPDRAMLDFMMTVWQVNRDLPSNRRLRVVLVDIQRPWRHIRHRDDWKTYQQCSRDYAMARTITEDIKNNFPHDLRHGLFIVGVGHAVLDLKYPNGRNVASTARYLCDEIGAKQVYSICAHMPRQTNGGRVHGRIFNGLVDEAMPHLARKATAFSLDNDVFGEFEFDAFGDVPLVGSFGDAFDALLYLGPLEDERFSGLIPGFYTPDFLVEVNRRHRLMFDRDLKEACKLAKLSAPCFETWMQVVWGQPRKQWSATALGPVGRWRRR